MRSWWYAFIFAFLAVFALPGCDGEEPEPVQRTAEAQPTTETLRVRPPAAAGPADRGFYLDTETELREQVNGFLKSARPVELPGELLGLMSPHAGYRFSGSVAAWAYRQLEGKSFDTVVILGLSHFVEIPGDKHAVSPEDAYRTPLGTVPIDKAARGKLLEACDSLIEYAPAHAREHSLETQIPFLQCTLKDFAIVPIALSRPTVETCRQLAKAIVELRKERNLLVVASSDLSHYPRYEDAVRCDKAMLSVVETLDPQGLLAADREWMGKGIPELRCTMCGIWPVTCLAMVAEEVGGCTAKVLKYANSGDVPPPAGDKSRVVGYGAMAVCCEKPATEANAASAAEDKYTLNEAEQKQLLKLARTALEACVNGKPLPKPTSDNPKLTRKSGAFVTLHENGKLRGCIGHLLAVKPLQEVIVLMARAAALEDPRFPNVKPDELKDIDVEISVLSPLRKIDNVDEIEVGKHGIVMTHLGRRGVLLPQVPVEQKWDRGEYLTAICRKTGVADRSWEQGAKLEVFTAQVFGEKE